MRYYRPLLSIFLFSKNVRMKKLKNIVLIAFIILVILLNSCISFKYPLKINEYTVFDDRMLGLWQGLGEGIDNYVLILEYQNKTLFGIVFEKNFIINDAQLAGNRMYAVKIDDTYYLNILLNKNEEYLIIKYEFKDNYLYCYYPNIAYFKEFIKNNNIQGEIREYDNSLIKEGIFVTESSSDLIEKIVNEKSEKLW